MFALSLVWLLLGVVIGALALGARLPWALQIRYGWAVTLGIGALAALFGGWLGALIFGRFFGTASAAWIAVLAVALVPWLINRRARSRSHVSAK